MQAAGHSLNITNSSLASHTGHLIRPTLNKKEKDFVCTCNGKPVVRSRSPKKSPDGVNHRVRGKVYDKKKTHGIAQSQDFTNTHQKFNTKN